MYMVRSKFLSIILIGFITISCESEKELMRYSLTTEVIPAESGKIIPSEGKSQDGEVVSVIAEPNQGWVFQTWDGDVISTSISLTLTMNSDKKINAIFIRKDYPLNITVEGEGLVEEKVVFNPNMREYPYETIVELIPKPKEGWEFVEWGGDLSGNNLVERITIDKEKNVVAKFLPSSFMKYFGGSKTDRGSSINKTSDGGYIITGSTFSNDGDFNNQFNGGIDIIVLKLNSNLEKQWIKTFGGSSIDIGSSVIESQDGGYTITGRTASTNGDFSNRTRNDFDIFVLKLDLNGNKVWTKTFGGANGALGYAIIQTQDGGYAVTGISYSNSGDFNGLRKGEAYTYLLKLNSSGEKQWIKSFGGSKVEIGNSIVPSQDGGYVITGITTSNDGDFNGMNKGTGNVFVIKTSSTGQKEWVKTFGGSNEDEGYSIYSCLDGGFVLTGKATSLDGDFNDNKGVSDVFVIKIDSRGEKEWIRSFGGTNGEIAYSIIQTENGGYILTGEFTSDDGDFAGLNKGDSDAFVIKLDSNGNKQWIKAFGGSKHEVGFSVVQSSDGSYGITGHFMSNDKDFSGVNKGLEDVLIIKISFDGI